MIEETLRQFYVENCALTESQKLKAEVLVEFSDVFAKQFRRCSKHLPKNKAYARTQYTLIHTRTTNTDTPAG